MANVAALRSRFVMKAPSRLSCGACDGSGARSIEATDEISLSDFDAIVPQDGVRRGDVKIEVRIREAEKKRAAAKNLGLAAERPRDLAVLATFELRGRQRAEVIDGPR